MFLSIKTTNIIRKKAVKKTKQETVEPLQKTSEKAQAVGVGGIKLGTKTHQKHKSNEETPASYAKKKVLKKQPVFKKVKKFVVGHSKNQHTLTPNIELKQNSKPSWLNEVDNDKIIAVVQQKPDDSWEKIPEPKLKGGLIFKKDELPDYFKVWD